MTDLPYLGTVDLTSQLSSQGRASWLAIAEMSNEFRPETWMVIGGRMVAIHTTRAGVEMPRPTTDVDIVIDVRAERRVHARELSDWLVESGFAIERNDIGTDRYRRGDARIDLLAPDHLSSPVQTSAGGRILPAPGSTKALNRSGRVKIGLGSGLITTVRCPTAFGALMAKAEACVQINEPPSRRLRHQQDIVTLAGILAFDGFEDDRTAKERRRFSEATAPLFNNTAHEAWHGASPDAREILRLIRS